ncbi:MAG: PEP-CTERM sorting domain-containing protein [Candidatus Acidiferrum sp.]
MKGYLKLGSHVLLALAVLTLWQGGSVAQADEIVGVFSNPIVQGNVLNDPTVGTLTSFDNTGTALVGVNSANAGCSGSNTLCWGSDPGSGLPLSQQYSELTFTGANVTGPNQTLGTINFLNGTSALNSLIFGATLTFYDATTGMTNLGSDTVIISTTSNQYSGTGLTSSELATDADYINICGNNSNICGSSLEAYEDSEGGIGVTATLTGSIVGDPHIELTGISANGQAANGGVVGNETPLGVPEPSTLTMMSAGLLVGAGLLIRRA